MSIWSGLFAIIVVAASVLLWLRPRHRQIKPIAGAHDSMPIPAGLERDLSPVVGEFTTQVRVGQFDLQFTFGPVTFCVLSPVDLFRDGELLAHWEEGRWPDPGFYSVMNTEVTRCEVVEGRLIVIEFENGISMHLEHKDDGFECMTISVAGEPSPWVI